MTSAALGLSTKQAEELLATHGRNEIVAKKQITALSIFIKQFQSFLVLILAAAAMASFFLSDPLDGIFIVAIIILNSVLGFVQEYRAERALQALTTMAASYTTVIRDGEEKEIDNRLLVPGDTIKIEEGDRVPADATLVSAVNLEVNEASLTGESLPVYKKEGEEDHKHVYLGTIVVRGRGVAVVEKTGMKTRFGSIAKGLSEIVDPPTPLQRELAMLGRQLAFVAVLAAILIFVFGFIQKQNPLHMFITSISLFVAAVPEGLPAVITITLAVGMHRIARARAIARKMAAIETLGCATIIATDKTGTITKNQMRVSELYINGENHVIRSETSRLEKKDVFAFLQIGVIANTANLVFRHDHDSFDIIGDPTEGALLVVAYEHGVDPSQTKDEGELLDEFSFDTKRKTMSVLWKEKQTQRTFAYVKGAPETLLERSTNVLMHGREEQLNGEIRKSIEEAFQHAARRGLRIIAVAKKIWDNPSGKKAQRDDVESDLTFIGFAGLSDPPRIEVKEAAKIAREGGIESIIITGDNELTANAIATETGLIKENEDILTGKQLDDLSDDELVRILPKVRIFARTTPEHKLRIVKAYQKLGHIVAVTGDGVNDALALRQADVGVAMGIAGTDVAKEAADIVVTDDNYATIVKAIEEGRVIFDNIVKSVVYLVSGNLSEILTIFLLVTFGHAPLPPVQILWINLVTDSLPALALAVDPKDPSVMKRRPRDTSMPIIGGHRSTFVLASGIAGALFVFMIFKLSLLSFTEAQGRTVAFTLLIMFHICLAFFVRRNHHFFSNRFLLYTAILIILLQLIILSVPPLHPLFKVSPLW